MDNVRPRISYSPIKRSYYTKPAFRPKNIKQDVKTSGVKNMTTAGTRAVVNTGKGKMDNALKKSRWVWRPKVNYIDHESKEKGSFILKKFEYVDPKGISKSVISQWCFKLPSPLPMLRGFPKAQILELNLDTRSILLQNNPPCPVKSQQKVGPLKHPPLPKLAKPASSFYTCTDPHVLADKTKYVSDGLETVLATPKIGTSNAVKTSEEIKFGAIKLEDLAKLVPNVKVDFKDLDSPKDDPIMCGFDDSE
ncbi:hypothetical protein Tco_1503365 [Tanacetum coccineum]